MKKILFLFLLFPFIPLNAKEGTLPSSLKPEAHQRDPYNWEDRHQAIIERHKKIKPEYVIIGDSITHYWGGEPVDSVFKPRGSDSWKTVFGANIVTNMGFGFDYADNAYYRVREGELDNTGPRVVILLIGTNNIGHRKDTASDCAANTKALVQLIREKCPKSTILLLGILPRMEPALAPVIEETNKLYAKIADGNHVVFANPGESLKEKDSPFPRKELMSDTVHLNAKGYEALGKEFSKILARLDRRYKKTIAIK